MRLFISFMPFLLPVLATDHKQCDCQINNVDVLDGDRFYGNCKQLAQDGWYPVVNGAINTTQPKITAKQGGSGCYN
ncbi:hypothetical protein FCIRC_8835 [Fusarium circinatum]|uniref:Uncharacterized protein n=1 Tax=Fusarium circinatum TaxID=48490 RepID=A0A8H5TK39_FUSCI|nr:hypothetical protein FCIRC_8835 [Fusarium circinatum]